ncbi:hypothetical protein M0R45_029164 [Rubus argutus]|uniref:DUF4283 domain-containing protein n=1 Tax=Rubus argutus TaxID=59490 RepID=A0AAW1W9G3_RUBAR
MAYSPNARAQASSSRNLPNFQWPSPFMRPAVNEPPRVVNANGVSITVERDETHIRIPQPPLQFLNHYQHFCLVGKIFGKPVPAAVVKAKCLAIWSGLQGTVTIDRLGNQWFRIEFTNEDDLGYVLDNRPWFVKGRIFHLRRWTPTFSATFAKIDKLAIWVRLPFLPLHYWDADMLASIVQVLGRFIRVDDATIRGEHCIFARVCIEIDLRFEACPARVMERHFLMVDRLHDEPAIYPPEMQGVEGVHQFASNDAMVFFPQPVSTYANVVNGGHGTHENRDVDGSEQSSPTWTAVSRARNRGTARNYNGRGGIRPTVGNHAPKTNEPVARSVPASPLNAGFGARTKISLRDRQVDDNNIIILPDSIEEVTFSPFSYDKTDVNTWPDLVLDDPIFCPLSLHEFYYNLDPVCFNKIITNSPNHWSSLISAAKNYDIDYQEAFQDATEIVQNDMADYANPDAEIDDTSDGFFEDPVVPMNYEEDLEIKIVRKRSRDMFNTDDELDIGSNSVNPTP